MLRNRFSSFKDFLWNHNWIIIVCLFLVVELIVFPLGNYPLNDDWAYSKAINDYLLTGKIVYSKLIAIPFLSQFGIGILYSKIVGFSFLKLRLLSMLVSSFSIFFFYTLIQNFLSNKVFLFLACIFFVFNPLFLTISNTFLPDVYILLWGLISIYFIVKFIYTENKYYYLLFLIISVIGTTTRQSGILIPFVFGVCFIFKNKKRINYKTISVALFPLIINFSALYIFQNIAKSAHFLPMNYNLQLFSLKRAILNAPLHLISTTTYYFFTSLICLSLFVFPIVLSQFKKIKTLTLNSKINRLILVFLLFFFVVKILVFKSFTPFVGNIFQLHGIGPIIMTGYNSDLMEVHSISQKLIFGCLSFIGTISFYSFLILIFDFIKSEKNQNVKNIIFILGLLIVLYLLLISVNYANDRYLLFILPFYILLNILFLDGLNNYKFKWMILFCIFFSVVIVKDYFQINDAKWKAIHFVEDELNVTESKIDAGLEYNAFANEHKTLKFKSDKKRWWWIVDDQYIISPIQHFRNYRIIKIINVNSSFVSNINSINVFKRPN
jgi:hypothetical protein